MALVGIELVTHASEPDALTTRPPPCAELNNVQNRDRKSALLVNFMQVSSL